MKFQELAIKGVFLIQHEVHQDDRGFFWRQFCENEISEYEPSFRARQTNISQNTKKHTLRGFHYQEPPHGENKILTILNGSAYDVVADTRKNSPTFGKWISIELSAKNYTSLLIPNGCANAFLTLEDYTSFLYCMSEFFHPSSYNGFRYNDPFFNISWPYPPQVIATRDLNYPDFSKD